ncbi:MAG: hypothetical protein K2L11_05700 [Muribaculaceae bacterium]|nr:hypothetical protein [Muribaculaceae bacterium]
MKKLLLLAALAASFSPAFADGFSENFKLTYEGEPIAPGQTITVNNYYDPIIMEYPELAGDDWNWKYESKAEIYATNISEEPKQLLFRARIIDPAELGDGMGNLLLCYNYESGGGNCLNSFAQFDTNLDPVSAEEYICIDAKQDGFTDFTPLTVELELKAVDEEKELGSATLTIVYNHKTDITMAVEGISAETKAEYFTIQGLRVAEPQKGQLVIERKGDKVAKRIF